MTREEALEILDTIPTIGKQVDALEMAIEALKADRPRGAWIIHGEPPMYVIECSQCGQKYFNHALQEKANFCSNCGAKMDGERSEE